MKSYRVGERVWAHPFGWGTVAEHPAPGLVTVMWDTVPPIEYTVDRSGRATVLAQWLTDGPSEER